MFEANGPTMRSRKDRETCHAKKVLSELVHFDSPFFFRLKLGYVFGIDGIGTQPLAMAASFGATKMPQKS